MRNRQEWPANGHAQGEKPDESPVMNGAPLYVLLTRLFRQRFETVLEIVPALLASPTQAV